MDSLSMAKPAWALKFLRDLGLKPDTSMDTLQTQWWGWYTKSNKYYKQSFNLGDNVDACERLSISPAAMVAGEIPSLVMTEGTQISSADEGVNEWLLRTMPNFVDEQADFMANVFALGTGAWVVDFNLCAQGIKSSIKSYNAWQVIPLIGGGCAFVSRVSVDGQTLDQLQVRMLVEETGTEHIFTYLFDTERHVRYMTDTIVEDLDTRQSLPTYAIVTPSKPNTHIEYTVLGSSIIEDAIDTFRLVDEAFNQLYWQVRLSLPRVIADDSGLKRDPKTGQAIVRDTLNQLLYSSVQSASGDMPITIYNPDTHISDMVEAINNALGMMGQRTGFGVGYWSFSQNTGLKTATEVVAANSALMRTIRRHEHAIENSIRDLVQGAYSAECALTGRTISEGEVDVTVVWDDSVINDDKQDRDTMKDDIARGLCPKWKYLVKYYGLSEDDARTFTGEAIDIGALALEIGE